ncbi:MAG: endonuclease III domain-containing protein [Candidatus Omnitrophota bacterium]|nr:MAG: endonuclease III domain-containing protein [Candidatus Omnitrophota bacterium]
MKNTNGTKKILDIYNRLYAHFGPQHWWPAENPFEVMVGAILTQNTAWSNVEKAITNLKRKKLLSPQKIERARTRTLAAAIKSSGFYNEKAKKLKAFIKFLILFCGSNINKLYPNGAEALRKEFLKIKGIGEETADSILLYALNKPIFVIDAYTKRIFTRHGLISEDATYGEIQKFFMDNIPKKVKLFNEYHALIVETGKNYCKKNNPLCEICPLKVTKNVVYYK